MLGGYWYMTCQTISNSAAILAEDFQMVSFLLFAMQINVSLFKIYERVLFCLTLRLKFPYQ